MARAIPPWLHRVLLRDRGPSDPWLMLVLFTVNSFMDEAGTCYPAQESIAEAAAMGVSTVRRKLSEASALGWLALETRSVYSGQHWRQYLYRACCPDDVGLEEVTVKDARQLLDGT